jgi:PIN domain nuclease of toxin-antitoxin system
VTGILLDSHILIWWLGDDVRLPEASRVAISDPQTPCFVSAATLWEIGIKRRLGKLDAPRSLLPIIEDEGFVTLDITPIHAERAADLPPIHEDPFDRLLIAQGMEESLTIATIDERFAQYGAELLGR